MSLFMCKYSICTYRCWRMYSTVVSCLTGLRRKLKNELLDMRSKGLRHPPEPGERQCPHCQRTLGLIFDRGEPCDECNQRVCCHCRVSLARGHWRCIICAKILWVPSQSGPRQVLPGACVKGGLYILDVLTLFYDTLNIPQWCTFCWLYCIE